MNFRPEPPGPAGGGLAGSVDALAASAADAMARRDWARLAELAHQWRQSAPGEPRAWEYLARSAFERGAYREAQFSWNEVVAIRGRQPADVAVLGRLALAASDLRVAESALTEARTLQGDTAEVLGSLGLLYLYLGRFEEAEDVCRRSLALNAAFVPAWTTLVKLRHGQLTGDELSVLAGIARHRQLPLDTRIPAAFALGQGLEGGGRHAQALEAYRFAHEMALARDGLEGRRYDPEAMERRTRALMQTVRFICDGAGGSATGTPTPIFIVGMPRSGTTLVESVLAAHSTVAALGERVEMQQVLGECLAQLGGAPGPEGMDHRLREQLMRTGLDGVPAGLSHFTDKHPLNFEAVAIIAALFPDAPVLNVRRDAVETCVSIYRNEFSKFWTFAHRPESLAHFYGQYARLMDFWERALPGKVTTIQYETLAVDAPGVARRIVAACGLPWEEGCARFQDSDRAITTLSAVSAREPVSLRRDGARKYPELSEALLGALRAASVDPETGRHKS